MRLRFSFLLLAMLLSFAAKAQSFSISGHVKDESGEALIGAVVYSEAYNESVITNAYGFYSLNFPVGEVTLKCAYIGYEPQVFTVNLKGDLTHDFVMKMPEGEGEAIVITANSEQERIKSTEMSTVKLSIEQIQNIPSLGGEVDVIKVMQLMPGVKRGGEGQTGLFVRGGGADQNLILLDEAVVYNISHLFGFFSVFNTDALKDVSMIKGGFPAQYGGRISSIMDIRMKEGDMQKYSVDGGIGMLSSRLTVQGPVIKDRMSFLVSARRSYIDKVFSVVNIDVPYYFYDLNGKLNFRLSDNDHIYYSTYIGNDVLTDPKDSGTISTDMGFGFKSGNVTNTLRWNHLYSKKLFSNYSLIHTRFRYDVEGKLDNNSLYVSSRIKDLGLKVDYDYYLSPKHHLKFGCWGTMHQFRPNIINAQGDISEMLKSSRGKTIGNLELATYIADEAKLTDKFTVQYGFRVSSLITDKQGYDSKPKLYYGLEPRAAASYSLGENSSVKLSYSRMYQYMHLVSSSSISLPTDLWYPVTRNIQPQSADQIAAGYHLFLPKLKTSITLEGYYKKMNHLIEYKEGAVLILNDDYEKELLEGSGEAYGFELLVSKTKGRLNGWMGYSLSWSTRQFDGLNGGKTYFSKYDRRHDLSLVLNYDISKRLALSTSFVYGTGSRFTALLGQYVMPNPSGTDITILPIYSDRNAYKFSPSYRWDINLVIKRKETAKWQGEWHIGGYNITNRTQPYRTRIVADPVTGGYKYEQVGLFGFIPSIAYNFKF